MTNRETGRIQFGTFDFDLATGELRREGITVRLQPQPAQVLGCLLARAGEVVSREELRAAVWGDGTFVDFDRSLNFCIAQVRSALGDSSNSPRFVRTLPKRGYQFIAPVASLGTSRVTSPVAAPVTSPVAAPVAVLEAADPVAISPLLRGRRKLLVLAAGILCLAALFLLLPIKAHSTPTRIAVARFDNLTGSPEFDRFTDGLTGAVIAELTEEGAGKYAVIGNAGILREPRSRRDLLAIHASLSVRAVVLGEVQRSPEGIHVFAQLIGVPEQSHRKAIRVRTAETDPVRAQAELATRILTQFEPALTSLGNP